LVVCGAVVAVLAGVIGLVVFLTGQGEPPPPEVTIPPVAPKSGGASTTSARVLRHKVYDFEQDLGKRGPQLTYQGEYEGPGPDGQQAAAQVVFQGKTSYQLRFYAGGLPGDGPTKALATVAGKGEATGV